MSARKPRYSAYTAVTKTDGIATWIEDRFDFTKPMTPDDLKKWREDPTSPKARIEAMQARLGALEDMTPAIKLHADAIRAIHASMPHALSGIGINNAQWEELRRADELWQKIRILRDVMPKAIVGDRHSKAQAVRARKPRVRAVTDEGDNTAISDIIARLARRKDELEDPLPHSELWTEFYAELDRLGLEPHEADDTIEYDYSGGHRAMTYRNFSSAISRARKNELR